jgi:ribosomal protein S2
MITIDRSALVEKLKEVGGHIAYTKSRRHPSTKPFLYNTKNAKDIIKKVSIGDVVKERWRVQFLLGSG